MYKLIILLFILLFLFNSNNEFFDKDNILDSIDTNILLDENGDLFDENKDDILLDDDGEMIEDESININNPKDEIINIIIENSYFGNNYKSNMLIDELELIYSDINNIKKNKCNELKFLYKIDNIENVNINNLKNDVKYYLYQYIDFIPNYIKDDIKMYIIIIIDEYYYEYTNNCIK